MCFSVIVLTTIFYLHHHKTQIQLENLGQGMLGAA